MSISLVYARLWSGLWEGERGPGRRGTVSGDALWNHNEQFVRLGEDEDEETKEGRKEMEPCGGKE